MAILLLQKVRQRHFKNTGYFIGLQDPAWLGLQQANPGLNSKTCAGALQWQAPQDLNFGGV